MTISANHLLTVLTSFRFHFQLSSPISDRSASGWYLTISRTGLYKIMSLRPPRRFFSPLHTLTTEHSNNHKYIFFLYFILSASLFSFLVTLFKD